MPIHEDMPVYNNNAEKKPRITVERDFVDGQGVREARLSINLHTGTHMDAPLHMIAGGSTTTEFKPENFILKAKLVDLSHVEDSITDEDLKQLDINEGDFPLFKTRNSFLEGFDKSFVFIEKSAANYLASKKVKGIGIDALGIERSQIGHPSHVTLMQNGSLILEGLRLKEVPPGEYLLLAAPVKIKDVEASPVRAILIEPSWLENFLKGRA
jgi:arylformamidase